MITSKTVKNIISALAAHKTNSLAFKTQKANVIIDENFNYRIDDRLSGKLNLEQVLMLASVRLYQLSTRDLSRLEKYLSNNYIDEPLDIEKVITFDEKIDNELLLKVIPKINKVSLTNEQIINNDLMSLLSKTIQSKIAKAENDFNQIHKSINSIKQLTGVSQVKHCEANEFSLSIHSDNWGKTFKKLSTLAEIKIIGTPSISIDNPLIFELSITFNSERKQVKK